ncbi:sigma-70 family RNA polymerase sigma factor [Sphingomonas sp. R-74633]|uniref:sigma-70 family RNA polymerase sigma factor n=1 Tax=Sphingomonas sp. R-74633 TaxID=2751188 RepID=UPI0015D10439|nr:sigma-70 family RNA polymerase sigma factor [Sphingomonas sp. R-74633]NYT40997.1 sigma-70 family RNA polymerase sigma factor [Sphingomonas sp. R-74633]
MNRELRRLRRAIAAMPDSEWQVFDGARYRDLDFFRIAAELDIAVPEVERLLASAMLHLMQFPK